MIFLEKHKALIITALLMGIFILLLANIGLSQRLQQKRELLVEVTPQDFLEEEEVPEEEETPDQQLEERKLIAAKRTHQAHNEDLKNFEDDAFEERYKSLTEKISAGSQGETQELTTTSESSETALTNKPFNESSKKDTGLKDEATPANTHTDTRSSSISFNLKDRQAMLLPNPIYTCNASGKIVINIKVNQNGYITKTKVNTKASSTKNQCLIDNAILYAKKARFSSTEKNEQSGSITYYFNYDL